MPRSARCGGSVQQPPEARMCGRWCRKSFEVLRRNNQVMGAAQISDDAVKSMNKAFSSSCRKVHQDSTQTNNFFFSSSSSSSSSSPSFLFAAISPHTTNFRFGTVSTGESPTGLDRILQFSTGPRRSGPDQGGRIRAGGTGYLINSPDNDELSDGYPLTPGGQSDAELVLGLLTLV
jgi:hypothetical protein